MDAVGGKRDVCYYDFLRRRRRPLRRTMIICIHSRTIGIKIRRLDNTSPSSMISEKKNLVEFRRGKGLLTVHRPAYHLEALDRRERRENIVCDLSPPLDDDKFRFRSLIVRRRLLSSSPV